MELNYSIYYNPVTSDYSTTCTGFRYEDMPGNDLNLKTKERYYVTSGYKIYNTESDWRNGVVGLNGAG